MNIRLSFINITILLKTIYVSNPILKVLFEFLNEFVNFNQHEQNKNSKRTRLIGELYPFKGYIM